MRLCFWASSLSATKSRALSRVSHVRWATARRSTRSSRHAASGDRAKVTTAFVFASRAAAARRPPCWTADGRATAEERSSNSPSTLSKRNAADS